MSMPADPQLGETWGFAQMSNVGKGYWYKIGLGRGDDAGRALGKVNTSPFKTFSGDIVICVHGTRPPGASPDPSFPLLRRPGMVEEDPEATLGVMWAHSAKSRSGKGYYEEAGVGWFDQQGRAHGRFLLTISSGFKGYVAICPPGVKPPQDPMPPSFIQPVQTNADDDSDNGQEDSEQL